jgi:hypothetical protein
MYKLITAFCLLLLCACGEHENEEREEAEREAAKGEKKVFDTTVVNVPAPVDTVTRTNSFKTFRDAVYQSNLQQVKSFIDFPIKNVNNEIWYLAYDKEQDKLAALPTDKIVPFTEADFNTYHEKIFTKLFINAINKIKTPALFTANSFETPVQKEGAVRYKCVATIDDLRKELTLNMAYTASPAAKGEDATESNVIYYFDMLANGTIKFRGVRLAG